jgi:hypothetical protein
MAKFLMLSQIDRQILRSWRQYAIEPRLARLTGRVIRTTGPRIAVVGNCQSYGVAYAMKLLDPSAQVDHYAAIGRARANMDILVRTLKTYDYVFSHEVPGGHIPGGDSDELCRRIPKTVMFPAIAFAAFHPDLIYLLDETRGYAQLFGPLGPYHSALAVFAFRKGLSLDEANALFNRNVYETLGYFDVWNDAAHEFLEVCKTKFDMDLSNELMNWARRGVFMYSIVHPKPYVLADIARRLFQKVGLDVREANLDHYAIDDLARAEIFPIYPEVGQRYGARGGYLFKMGNFHVSNGVGDFLTLPQYLSSCFKIYRSSDVNQIAHPRIDAWLADAPLSETLTQLARENLKAGLLPVL